eukprot:Em0013g438a
MGCGEDLQCDVYCACLASQAETAPITARTPEPHYDPKQNQVLLLENWFAIILVRCGSDAGPPVKWVPAPLP